VTEGLYPFDVMWPPGGNLLENVNETSDDWTDTLNRACMCSQQYQHTLSVWTAEVQTVLQWTWGLLALDQDTLGEKLT
jgi:hypothetical protein